MNRRPLCVVKLGGSLASSPELKSWLEVIAQNGAGHTVIVPGGGPFADAVREAQQHQPFDDAAAHRMALLAMEQYGVMLAALQPELMTANSVEGMEALLSANKVAVWMPSAMALACTDLPCTWELTSDSLAAWLAAEIGAEMLVLVKSVQMERQISIEEMQDRSWVDPLFVEYTRELTQDIRRERVVLLGPGDRERLSVVLSVTSQRSMRTS